LPSARLDATTATVATTSSAAKRSSATSAAPRRAAAILPRGHCLPPTRHRVGQRQPADTGSARRSLPPGDDLHGDHDRDGLDREQPDQNEQLGGARGERAGPAQQDTDERAGQVTKPTMRV
jgi:hypothetical protein